MNINEIETIINKIISSYNEFLIDTTSDTKRRFIRYLMDKKNRWEMMFIIFRNNNPQLIDEYEYKLISYFINNHKNKNRPGNPLPSNKTRHHNYIFVLAR